MALPINPYVAGAPIRGEKGFFGRQGTLNWVKRELRNPTTNALVLFGQRRIGKTSLLLKLQHTLPTDTFMPVYFDLQDQATRPLGQVLADLADTIAEKVQLESPDPEAFDNQGRFFHRTFLPQLYQAIGGNCRPVFLMDEFDVMGEIVEAGLARKTAAKALFSFLRRVMTEDTRSAFIFAVGRRAADLSVDFTATFKGSLVQEVWVLDRESAEALVRHAETNDTLRFTDRAVARVLGLTSCHPYLTQLLCQRIWERAYAGPSATLPLIDSTEVESAVPDALEVGNQALVWLWNGLTTGEKIYASALAEAAKEEQIIPEERVIQVLTTHAPRLRTREVELAPSDLLKRRVLEEVRPKEYRFAVELFRRWVRWNMPLREVKDGLDRIDPLADRLFIAGNSFFSRRQWAMAMRYFRDALEANADHLRARLYLGEALLELGQTDQAVTEMKQAYELDRDEARLPLTRALLAQAKAREKSGDEDGVLTACEQALQIVPTEQTAQVMLTAIWTRRGDAALERGDLQTALAAYKEAGDIRQIARIEVLQQRQALAALEMQAQTRAKAEKWTEAAAIYEQLVAQAPTEESRTAWQVALQQCWEKEAQAYEQMGKWEEAAARYRHLTVQAPEDESRTTWQVALEQCWEKEAQAYEQMEKWEEAAAIYEQLIAQASNDESRTVWQVALERCWEEEELARLFGEGMGALSKLEWQRAQGVFAEVVHCRPDYRKGGQLALHLLEQIVMAVSEHRARSGTYISHGVSVEAEEKELAYLFTEGVGALRQQEWQRAQNAFAEVVHRRSDYRKGGQLAVHLLGQTIIEARERHVARSCVVIGDRGSVKSVAFSPNGKILALGSDDKTLQLRQILDGKPTHTLEGHTDIVYGVAFSSDGMILASGGDDTTVRLWKVSDGSQLRILEGHKSWVNCVAFSTDSKLLASGSWDGTVRLWRVPYGTSQHVLEGHTSRVTSVALSLNGRTLASGSGDSRVRLWRVSDGTPLRILEGHTGWVSSLAFSPDGKTLASGSGDSSVRLWRVSDGALLRTFEGHTGWVSSLAFSPDGVTLVSGAGDTMVRMWRVSDGMLLRILVGHIGPVLSVTFLSDELAVASASWDGTVRSWKQVGM
jgi:tetratricopeptide (TPR) repeat protein